LFIQDPDPDFLPILDQGVKKAQESGSATLSVNFFKLSKSPPKSSLLSLRSQVFKNGRGGAACRRIQSERRLAARLGIEEAANFRLVERREIRGGPARHKDPQAFHNLARFPDAGMLTLG
jgi:hypothetical protein